MTPLAKPDLEAAERPFHSYASLLGSGALALVSAGTYVYCRQVPDLVLGDPARGKRARTGWGVWGTET